MAKTTFDLGEFLQKLKNPSDIHTGDSINTMPDADVPSNVINKEDWKRQELMKQRQNIPVNLEETKPYLPGGQYNPRPTAIQQTGGAIREAAPVGVLEGTTNPSAAPVAVNRQSGGSLDRVPSSVDLQQQREAVSPEEQNRTIEEPMVGREAPPPDDYIMPEVTVKAEKEVKGLMERTKDSLAKLFEKQMSKVKKIEFGKMTEDQRDDMQLRFFLNLMAEGGKKNGKGLLGNIGTAGLNTMDASRVIQQENDRNEIKRFDRDSTQVFNALTLEGRDRNNQINSERWKLAATVAADRIKRGEMKTMKGSKGWELCDKEKCKPMLDVDGKQLQHNGSDGKNLSGKAQLIEYLRQGTPEERKSKMETHLKANPKTAREIVDQTHTVNKDRQTGIQKIIDGSGDEFGQGRVSEEKAAQIYDNRMGGKGADPEPESAPVKYPPHVQKTVDRLREELVAGNITKEQAIETMQKEHPYIKWD